MKNYDQYFVSLETEKKALLQYIKEQTDAIKYPQPVQKVETSTSNSLPKPLVGTICIGGVALVIAGLVTSKFVVGATGVVATIAGLYLNKQKVNTNNNVSDTEFDFSAYGNSLYQKLQQIKSSVSKGWDEYLGSQNEAIKSEIRRSTMTDEIKNKMTEEVTKRSVIDFSMMNVLSEISSISNKKSMDAFKQYVGRFSANLSDQVCKAYEEQKETYTKMLSLNN